MIFKSFSWVHCVWLLLLTALYTVYCRLHSSIAPLHATWQNQGCQLLRFKDWHQRFSPEALKKQQERWFSCAALCPRVDVLVHVSCLLCSGRARILSCVHHWWGCPVGFPSPHYKSFQQIILLFSTQLAVPDASAFLLSHTGECCLHFSLFYHRTLQLDIPLPCIVLCAFFPVPLVPVPVPVPIPCMPLDRTHTQQLCRQCRTGGSGWCSGQLSVAPEGPQETQGVGQQKLPEVQQWDMQSPARDEGGGGRKTLCTRPGWKSAGWAAILERTWGLQWVLHWMLSNLYSHHKKGKSHPGGSGNSLESGSEEFVISSVQCQGGHIWILWAEPI